MDQKNTIIAIALSMAVLLGWQLFFAPDPPPPAEGPGAAGAASGPVVLPGSAAAPGSGAVIQPAPPQPGQTPPRVIAPEEITLTTGTWEAIFTNEGARLKSFRITAPENFQSRGNLVEPVGDEEHPTPPEWVTMLPYATTFSGRSISLPEGAMFEVVEKGERGVTFRYTDPAGAFTLDKVFTRNPDKPYSFNLDVKVQNTGAAPIGESLQLIIYGYQLPSSEGWSPLNPIPDVSSAVCSVDGDIEHSDLGDAKDQARFSGAIPWGGLFSRYFSMAAIPQGVPLASCQTSTLSQNFIRNALGTADFSVAPGAAQSWSFTTYVGPNRTDDLEAMGAGLEDIIDYGIFAPLCRPIHWLLLFIQPLVGNWGLAIILLTLLLRGLTFPINQRGYKYMEAMRQVQPKMEAIRKQYEGDQLKQNEKIMELYKQEGVSPFGCLPQFVQIPVFFALYRTIYSSAELYHADFALWYTNLTDPDPYYILPVIVTAMMFGQQLLMPTATDNKQMKLMMNLMPLMFGVFTLVMPSALGLYMVTSVGLGILQQYLIRRYYTKKREAEEAKASA